MTYFAKDKVLYIDASSGGIWPNWDSLNKIFTTYMPKWPASGLSYPTRIYGDAHSALVAFTDTPELFGKELRILGAVSFDDNGKIIRWMDYWDGRSSQRVTAPLKPTYPTVFHDDVGNATGKIHDVTTALNTAFAAGDAKAAAAMFSYDAVSRGHGVARAAPWPARDRALSDARARFGALRQRRGAGACRRQRPRRRL